MATGSDAELLAMALDPDVLRVLARETYKPLILGTCITLMVVVTTAVTLRICARRIAKVRLQAEDWTILLAMVCVWSTPGWKPMGLILIIWSIDFEQRLRSYRGCRHHGGLGYASPSGIGARPGLSRAFSQGMPAAILCMRFCLLRWFRCLRPND